jgi:CHAT domain-containing protein
LALFADPVFETEDPRLVSAQPGSRQPQPSPRSPASDLARATRAVGVERIVRLPFARVEAEELIALVEEPSQALVARGLQATREAVLATDLASYRLVHFATHGWLNDRHPSLSGVVLSLVDASGRDVDGFLRIHEIDRLELAADLVVLSACQTALGEEVPGEGIVGMAHAFFRAGARGLVASHWSVDDEATAHLMIHFYRGMLGPEALPPAAALRAAQRAVRREETWREPYYWAAFTLQGDWR